MAGFFGNAVARNVQETQVWCSTAGWTALETGSSPLSSRQWIEFQVKGSTALALQYVNINADGTFTAPTDDVRRHIVIPANSIKGEPLSDSVRLYGRAVAKAGNTDSGTKVIVKEYA